MGHRANYVVVEGTGYTLYYSHWGAASIAQDLFWGPVHAMRFLRRQKRCRPDDWLNDIWAEGGALIDPGQRRLLLFGGEEIGIDLPLRRHFMELLQTVWSGWQVCWATDGLADIVDYLGLERSLVLSDEPAAQPIPGPPERAEEFPPETVCSVRWPDGSFGLYPMAWDPESLLDHGPELIDHLADMRAEPELVVAVNGTHAVLGGLHLDANNCALEMWGGEVAPDIVRRAAIRWPGWAFTWHGDRFESQAERANGQLCFAEPPRGILIRRLSRLLLEEVTPAPLRTLAASVEQYNDDGEGVWINPWTLAHTPQDLSRAERAWILEQAAAALERSA